MGRRLPPLNSLRALEAAARHLSFTKAAEELHVTPAAISHQIKGLEEHLGVPLFRRLNRAVLLTDAGQACLPGLSEAFDRIAAVLERLRAQDRDHQIEQVGAELRGQMAFLNPVVVKAGQAQAAATSAATAGSKP
jgi:DNA-binding transcriptional LysR family regulator